MRTSITSVAGIVAVGLPLLAGALMVEVGNPVANPEAAAKHAVLVLRTTACHSPEKTSLTATAEGVLDGQRRSIPLNLIPLSTPGTFAVTREWPSTGTWAVKVVARNPEYQNYATAALVRFDGNSAEWASVKHYFHEPSADDVNGVLDTRSGTANASLTHTALH
jgi:hypothetical protein